MDLPDASSPVAFVRNVSINRNIGLFSFKNGRSLLERGSARPFLDDSWVSRIREGSLSKIRSDQKQITPLVGDAGFCFADVKGAVFLADKLFGGQIKFFDVHGIGSSTRQLEECSRDNFSVGRITGSRKKGSTLVDPADSVFLGQCVHVQDGFPGGFVLFVFVFGRLSPDSLGMSLVLPEIVIDAVITLVASVTGRIGNSVFRLEDLQDATVGRPLFWVA
mmetsp:Transcript_1275/g.2929  ORF Transcript_1275/g.2929 Transcript_1275/m.2929 type:complete len:220 (+) Transcript_1275:1588-2247(+)